LNVDAESGGKSGSHWPANPRNCVGLNVREIKVDYKDSGSNIAETARVRLAQLPFGLILFIMMIIALSYFFDGTTSQAQSSPGAVMQTERK